MAGQHMPPNGFSHLAISFYVACEHLASLNSILDVDRVHAEPSPVLFCEPIQAFMIQRFPAAKYLGVMGSYERPLR